MAETITNVSVGIVTGERSKIDSATVKNGRIYFSKDTGELFYDWNGARVQVCPQTSPNNATLSIKANGTDVSTFTANSSINRSIDISAGTNITINSSATTGKIIISGTADTWRGVYTGGTSRVGTGTSSKAINYVGANGITVSYLAAGTGSGQSGSANYFNVSVGHTNSITAGDVSATVSGKTLTIPKISYDAQGHITAVTSGTVTTQDTDTKNTAGSNQSTSKLFLVGPTSQTSGSNGAQTYSNVNVYTQNGSLYATAMYEGSERVATKTYVDGLVANATHYKGTFNATNGKINGGSTTLTSVAEKIGDLYKCDTAGTYLSTAYEVGDSIYFIKDVAASTAPVATDITSIEGTVSVSVPSTVPTIGTADTTLGTVEGVAIKAKIGSYLTRSNLNSSLNALDASILAGSGKYVAGFEEVDGLIKNATYGTLPTVNNGTLTITVNGTDTTFTANQAGDSAVSITVPSLSDLDASFTAGTNQAIVGIGQVDGKITTAKYGTFLTSHQSLADYATKTWVNSSIQALDASFTAGTNQAIVGIGQVDGKITTAKYGTFLTSHQSLAGYATQDWVNSSLANYSKGNSEIYKGICSTGATTAAKVVTCSAFTSAKLVKGAIIFVTFDYTNTAAVGSITMNVNSTGAKPIKKIWMNAVSNLNNNQELQANETYIFQYDGTNWVCMNCDWTYTYSKITTSAIDSLSTGDNWCIDGSLLKYAVDKWAPNPDLTNYVTTSQYNTNMPNNFSGVYVWATPSTAANASINVSPDSSKDVLTFKAGTNVTLTGDAANDIITINAVDTTYSAGDGISINSTNNQISAATNIKVKVGDSSFLIPAGGNNPGILDISAGPNVTITPDVNAKRITVAASGFVQGDGISIIKAITQSAYEALTPKDPSTVYIVTADLD